MIRQSNSRAPQPESGRSERPTLILLVGILTVMVVALLWIVKMAMSGPSPAPAPVEAAAPEPSPEVNVPAPDAAPVTAPVSRRVAKNTEPPPPSIEEQYGIQVRGVRMAMGRAFLDLRYKVVDPVKATKLAGGTTSAFLVDSGSGALLLMPKPPGEGAFPPTGNKLASGRTYFALVANPQKLVRSGSELVFHVDGASPTKLVVQ